LGRPQWSLTLRDHRTFFAQFNCQGVCKSVDYVLTWFGPINAGRGGAVPAEREDSPLREVRMDRLQSFTSAGIRDTGPAFWKSADGGVSWTNYRVAPGGDHRISIRPWSISMIQIICS